MTVLLRFRAELGRLGRSLGIAAFVGGVAALVSLTALTGAWRTDRALADYLDRTAYPDVAMDVFDLDDARLEQVASLEMVEDLGGLVHTAQQPRGLGLTAGIDVGGAVAMTDEMWLAVDRWDDVEGRPPTALGEVLVESGFAARHGLGLGDELVIDAMAPDQLSEIFGDGPVAVPRGRSHSAVIVGIAHDALRGQDSSGYASLYLPRIFGETHAIAPPVELGGSGGDVLAFRPELRATLVDGVSARDGFIDAVSEIYDGAVETGASSSRSHVVDTEQPGLDVDSTARRLFGLAAAFVGLVAFGHVVARVQAVSSADDTTLSIIGLRRWQRRAVLWLLGAVALAGAMAIAIVGSILLSPWSVSGLVAEISPSGLVVAPEVIVPGAIAIGGMFGTRMFVSGYTAVGPERSTRRLAGLARVARRAAPTAPSLIGSRFALHAAPGSQATPIRPILVGAAAGISAVVAAITVGWSLQHLLATPELWGHAWEAQLVFQATSDDSPVVDSVASTIVDDPRVAGVTHAVYRSLDIEGLDIAGFEFEPIQGPPTFGMLSGRLPSRADEIAFDGQDLGRLDLRIGDRVVAGVEDGDRVFEIVGQIAGRSPALVRAAREVRDDNGVDVSLFVSLRQGVDADSYRADVAPMAPEVYGPDAFAGQITRLERIRSFPTVFAAFLAMVSLSAVGHGLALTVRRRRVDLGVLRALGYSTRKVRRVIRWQASTVIGVGTLFGLPIGLGASAVVWGAIADSVDVATVVVVPIVGLMAALAAAVVCTVGVAAPSARRAGRLDPAATLRGE